MKYSMDDYLSVGAPYIVNELISPEAFARVRSLARLLPPSAGSGFECRLGSRSAEADFLVRVTPHDGTRAAYAGHNPGVAPPASFLEEPVWERVQGFCARWADAGDPLHAGVSDMWLEFDMDGLDMDISPPPIPIPGIFFGTAPDVADQAGVIAMAVSALRGRPDNTPLPPGVSRCLEALPRGATIQQIGMMFSRQTDDLRLCAVGLASADVPGFLARAGWEGPMDELRALIARMTRSVENLVIDLDVGDTVRPKLGLEGYIDRDPTKARWEELFRDLTERGECTPEKQSGVLAWLGYSTQRSLPERWPINLLSAKAPAPDYVSGFVRHLNHVKMAYQPGRPLEAKAYLSLMHRWIRVTKSEP